MNKNYFKKVTAFLCIAIMLAFGMIGCSSTKDDNNNNNNGNNTGGHATEAPENVNPTDNAAVTPDSTGGAITNDTTDGGVANEDTADGGTSNGDTSGGTITGAKAGTYTASAKGYASDVKVTLTVDDKGKVTKIDVDASGETENIGQSAAPEIAKKIVDTQTLNVDSVSGATYTSTAVMTAVKDALKQAGVDSSMF